MRFFSRFLTIVVAVAAFGPAAIARAAPVPGISIVGASEGASAVTADLDAAQALGVRTVRMEAAWRELEPDAAGVRDPAALANLDAIVDAARTRRIRIVLLLDSTPCWASTAPAALRDGCRTGVSSYPPSDYQAYGRLGAFLASRFHGGLAALEVWNEPDQANERYWAGPDKASRYAALVRATYPLVKAADPSLPVLAGAFVGTDGRFLQALYKAGIKGAYDGLSVHFYDLPLLALRQTRATQVRNGDRKPLWLLEMGWNSCAPAERGTEGQTCVTRANQARDLTDFFAQTRLTTYLRAAVVYKLRDDRVDRFGVINGAGTRKPSFGAFRDSIRRPTSRVRRPTLQLRRTSRGLVVFGDGPNGDAYRLEVRAGTRLRYRATFRMDSRNRFSLRLPRQLGTSGLRVRLVSQWRGGPGTVRRS